MILQFVIVSVAIFAVMAVWILIQRWVAKSRAKDECTIPNQECGHCIMVDSCPMAGDVGGEDPDTGAAPPQSAEGEDTD